MKNAWAQKVATRLRWEYPMVYAMITMAEKFSTKEDTRAKRRNLTFHGIRSGIKRTWNPILGEWVYTIRGSFVYPTRKEMIYLQNKGGF